MRLNILQCIHFISRNQINRSSLTAISATATDAVNKVGDAVGAAAATPGVGAGTGGRGSGRGRISGKK
jgi:hypothetical protein